MGWLDQAIPYISHPILKVPKMQRAANSTMKLGQEIESLTTGIYSISVIENTFELTLSS
jgi:hypothetical protein